MPYFYKDHNPTKLHDNPKCGVDDTNIEEICDESLHDQAEASNSGNIITVSPTSPSWYPKTAQYVDDASYRREIQFQKSEAMLLNTECRLLTARDNRHKWEKEEQRRRNIEQLAWTLQTLPCGPFNTNPCSDMMPPHDALFLPKGLREIAFKLSSLFGFYWEAVIFMLLHLFVVAVHGRVAIKLDPMWSEAMECYGIVVRDSGGKKTELMKHLKAPFLLFLEKIRLSHEMHSCDKRVLKEMKGVQNNFSKEIAKEIFPIPVYEVFKACETIPLEKRFDILREKLTEMFHDTDKSIPDQKEPPRIFFTNITPKRSSWH